MQHLRNSYLYEMGITPWQLCQSERVLQQAKDPCHNTEPDLSHIAVLVVCQQAIADTPLFTNILAAMHLAPKQALCVTVEQFENLTGALPKLLWAIDCQLPSLPGHQVIYSDALAKLASEGEAKKHLWHQICQHSKL